LASRCSQDDYLQLSCKQWLLLFLVLIAIGCRSDSRTSFSATGSGASWPHPFGDYAYTGSGFADLSGNLGRIVWESSSPDRWAGGGIVIADSIFVSTSMEGEKPAPAVTVFSMTGAVSRVFAIQGERAMAPVWAGPDTLAVPVVRSGRVHVVALDVRSGRVRWQRELDAESPENAFPVNVAAPDLLSTALGDSFEVLSLERGATRWRGPALMYQRAPAAHQGNLYFTDREMRVNAVRAFDGTQIWARSASDLHVVAVDEHGLLLGGQNALEIWDVDSGSPISRKEMSAPPEVVAMGRDRLFVATEDELIALRRPELGDAWRKSIEPTYALAADASGNVAVLMRRNVALFSPEGELRWSVRFRGTAGWMALAGRRLFVLTAEGNLVCIE
jgi:outer membrane protein assembly factor BamB